MQETDLKADEAAAIWKQKIAEQRKVLKTLSKNQLIRIVIDMSVRAFYQDAKIQELEGGLSEDSINNPDSTES